MPQLKKHSQLIFSRDLPAMSLFGPQTLVICDRRLLRTVPKFSKYIEQAPAFYAVSAGEELKDLKSFPQHIEKILHRVRHFSPAKLRVVAIGGGSVGDFSGFVASVLKRGVKLIHIPSTWLSAIDSAHGGKTALNVKGFKNQIGTFYPAEEIYLVRSLLFNQPGERINEAYGELGKMALIDGRKWVRSLAKEKAQPEILLWKYLPSAIESKYRVVDQDPYEKKRIRQILNLGHTFGHVLEAERGRPHGEAVAQGLYFALRWSLQNEVLSLKEYLACVALLENQLSLKCDLEQKPKYRPLSAATVEKYLYHDKKRTSKGQLDFVFLERRGHAFLQKVTIQEVVREAKRQGWAR